MRILLATLLCGAGIAASAQTMPTDTLVVDSLWQTIPEVMVEGERPIVKARGSVLIYDLPRLIENTPVGNIFESLQYLTGVTTTENAVQLMGRPVSLLIDGKPSTLSADEQIALLKTLPVSRLQSAEVILNATASYQTRGMAINILLKHPKEQGEWNGEVKAEYSFARRPSYSEQAGFIYSHRKLSMDVLLSASQSHLLQNSERHARHWLHDNTIHVIDNTNLNINDNYDYKLRWGMDYSWSDKHALGLVYTAQLGNSDNQSITEGTLDATNFTYTRKSTHQLSFDYSLPFGLQIGMEGTIYHRPSRQEVNSRMYSQPFNFSSDESQHINRWKTSITQRHALPKSWEIAYGGWYMKTNDRSRQAYRNADGTPLTADSLPLSTDNSRNEMIANIYFEGSKSFNDRLSVDFSLAGEYIHSSIWNGWSLYPVFNLTYRPADAHLVMLGISTDKAYPQYWEMQAVTGYMSGNYTIIEGNPELQPSKAMNMQLTYMLKNKYSFSAWFNRNQHHIEQTLYQLPERLAEIYKTVNHDFEQQIGALISVPFEVKNVWDSRLMGMVIGQRVKNSHFWTLPFDRNIVWTMFTSNNTFKLSPLFSLTVDGMIRSKAIQATYDLPWSANVTLGLKYVFAHRKGSLQLRCDDLLQTNMISPRLQFGHQNLIWKNASYRRLTVSFAYRFGDYREKQRKDIDSGRFK